MSYAQNRTDLAYRPDVDGLRALAVAIVILFHGKFGVFPGGYVGVDVFFVISGYLITSVIWSEIRLGSFSIAGFYERRIRRIFPALAVVVLVSLVVGASLLAPQDYFLLGRSARATAAFYSNFYFKSQAGYFAPGAETQPLLHTWSLAVEEQFYLVAPLFLLLLARMQWPLRVALFVLLFLASLTVSVLGAAAEAKSAFYFPHSRAFELMIGMGIALGFAPTWRSDSMREAAGFAGLALIALAALFYNDETPFPGLAALVPCVGAALLIANPKAEGTIVSRALSRPALVGAGKISYSLYLWHWPLFVFGEYLNDGPLPLLYRVALVVLAGGLSVVTYEFVEQPARQRTFLTRRTAIAGGVTAMAILVALSHGIIATRGLPQRLPPEAAALFTAERSKVPPVCPDPDEDSARAARCSIGAPLAPLPTFLFWGDSHGISLAPQLSDIAAKKGLKGIVAVIGGCPPLLPRTVKNPLFERQVKCQAMSRHVADLLKEGGLRHVVIAARWPYYFNGGYGRGNNELSPFDTGDSGKNFVLFAESLRGTVEAILATGRTVTLVGPIPELQTHLPNTMMRAIMRGDKGSFDLPVEEFELRQATALRLLSELDALPGVKVVYPHKILCNASVCRTTDGALPLYYDDDHLNSIGAKVIESVLADAIDFGALRDITLVKPR